MKLRKVLTTNGPQVGVLQTSSQAWIPLSDLTGLAKLSNREELCSDILVVLATQLCCPQRV